MNTINAHGFYPRVMYRNEYVFVPHEASNEITGGVAEINLRDYYPMTFRRDEIVLIQDVVAGEIRSGFTTINLTGIYANAILGGGSFVKVTNEVADELFADRRSEKAHERDMYRNKAHYSLDADDGIEASAIVCYNDSPERVFDMMERHTGLCRALNSLPEIQGKRVEAHIIFGKTQSEIAESEGVSVEAVSKAIEKGLARMKNNLKKYEQGG